MEYTHNHELPIGTQLNGRYRIIAVLSPGGFGITYKAEDERLKQTVCVKELFISGHCTRGQGNTVQSQGLKKQDFSYYREKFIEEARQLVRFRQPGIVQVFDVFEENGTAYYAMEFIEGEALDALIKHKKRLPVAEAMQLTYNLLNAVETLHRSEPPLLHRDIKPANIMLRGDGSPVLIDFGNAREFKEGMSISQTQILTPGYAPLEQYHARAKRGPFMDVYAIGATLYIMLTGEKPAAATDRALSEMPHPLELNPQLPAALSGVVMKALALKPEDRYQDVASLRRAMHEANAVAQESEQEAVSPPDSLQEARQALKILRDQTQHAANLPALAAEAEKLLQRYEGEQGAEWEDWNRDAREFSYTCHRTAADIAFSKKSFSESKKHYEQALRHNPNCTHSRSHLELIANTELESAQFNNNLWKSLRLTAGISLLFVLPGIYMFQIREGQENLPDTTSRENSSHVNADTEATHQVTNNHVLQTLKDNMVYVAGGTFTMGCTDEQGSDCSEDEKPVHQVTLSSFKMGKYEVTQAEWEAVISLNPSYFKNCHNCPVENVSWMDIQIFLEKLNQLTNGNYRLPTEAEWEYAVRGGNGQSGTINSGSDIFTSVAWYNGNSGNKTHPVGQKDANALGLYDMSGNVREWCSDWFGAHYYSSSPISNPRGPSFGTSRVCRGGSWNNSAGSCRVSIRNGVTPYGRGSSLGFRLVSPGS